MAKTPAEINRQVRSEFSPEEIDRFMKICINCVEKTVLHTVARILDDCADKAFAATGNAADLRQLSRDVLAVSTQRSQPFVVEVPAGGEHSAAQILINLAPCAPDWKTRVAVPSEEIGRQVYAGYDYLRRAAHVYWNHFAKIQPALCNRIITLAPSIDWKIKPEPSQTTSTMWFDQASPHHMGIICSLVHDEKLFSF